VFARLTSPSPRRAAVADRHGCDFAVVATLAAVEAVGCPGQSVWPNRSFSSFGPFRRYAAVPALSDRMMRPVVALGARLSRSAEQGAAKGGSSILPRSCLGSRRLLWAPCAGPLLGLILTGPRSGSKPANLVAAHAYAAGAATSLALALLAESDLSAMKRSLGIGEWVRGSGRRDSHCGRRDHIGSRHRLSHPRVPRKHGFARTSLLDKFHSEADTRPQPSVIISGGPAMMTPNPPR